MQNPCFPCVWKTNAETGTRCCIKKFDSSRSDKLGGNVEFYSILLACLGAKRISNDIDPTWYKSKSKLSPVDWYQRGHPLEGGIQC